jgi:uncharacterized membrane protein
MIEDAAIFCGNCGAQQNEQQPAYQSIQQYTPAADAFDHTAEFTSEDISSNKVISMLVYLLGWIGIVIALLASNTSKYVAFHVRQALKFVVVETLTGVILGVGVVICIIPVLGWIAYILAALGAIVLFGIFFVLKIICFFQICKGQAKEPPIIRDLKFLK